MFLITTIATIAFVVIDWGHAPLIICETARYPEKTGVLMVSALGVREAG
jgi:hypothetical protein